MWQIAPKRSIDMRKLKLIVDVMRTANFLNVMTYPPKRAEPLPKVVMVPLMILIPISK
jgi:hypothetical protein